MQDESIQQITYGGYHSMILKKSGDLFVFGLNESSQLGLGDNEDLVLQSRQVKNGYDSYPFFYQNKPELLMQDESISQIVCGGWHSMILKKNGELFVFGRNYSGQLGLGNYNYQNKPIILMQDENISQIVCGQWHSMILKKNGDLFVFGDNGYGQLGLGNNDNLVLQSRQVKNGYDSYPFFYQNKPILLMQDEKYQTNSMWRFTFHDYQKEW
jgi:alpha-tubulin suppressor-like RCC1 family protein